MGYAPVVNRLGGNLLEAQNHWTWLHCEFDCEAHTEVGQTVTRLLCAVQLEQTRSDKQRFRY